MLKNIFGLHNIGSAVAVAGTAVSILGSWANSIWLDHNLAIIIWAVSNPLMALWSIGYAKKWWDGGISGWSLVIMYIYYIITNAWALMQIC
jgi:hypothetical protein